MSDSTLLGTSTLLTLRVLLITLFAFTGESARANENAGCSVLHNFSSGAVYGTCAEVDMQISISPDNFFFRRASPGIENMLFYEGQLSPRDWPAEVLDALNEIEVCRQRRECGLQGNKLIVDITLDAIDAQCEYYVIDLQESSSIRILFLFSVYLAFCGEEVLIVEWSSTRTEILGTFNLFVIGGL